jgi:hypothetical protein
MTFAGCHSADGHFVNGNLSSVILFMCHCAERHSKATLSFIFLSVIILGIIINSAECCSTKCHSAKCNLTVCQN